MAAASFLLGERGKLSHFEKGVEEEAEISLAAYCGGCGGGGGGGVGVVGIAVWREGDAVAEVSYGNLRTEDQI